MQYFYFINSGKVDKTIRIFYSSALKIKEEKRNDIKMLMQQKRRAIKRKAKYCIESSAMNKLSVGLKIPTSARK